MVNETFIEFIKQCFSGDLRTAELRLSDEEKDFIACNYPGAGFRPIKNTENYGGKIWYEVTVA